MSIFVFFKYVDFIFIKLNGVIFVLTRISGQSLKNYCEALKLAHEVFSHLFLFLVQ